MLQSAANFLNNLAQFDGGYCTIPPLESAVVYNILIGTIVWILSKITNDFSWVDRLWSLIPIAYCMHFFCYQITCMNAGVTHKQGLIFILICLWGFRLTYNFYRKGGYTLSGEDYRWIYIRKHFSKWQVQILNFFFTSYYQLFLLQWIVAPVYLIGFGEPKFDAIDIALVVAWMIVFTGQTLADQQQWIFQTFKHRLLKSNSLADLPMPFKLGFMKDGLWKYSRHPNFFCEMSMWWIIAFMSIKAIGLNWSVAGALLLNLLFLGSTQLTEIISAEKYPLYTQYQKTTNRLIPWFPGKSQKFEEMQREYEKIAKTVISAPNSEKDKKGN